MLTLKWKGMALVAVCRGCQEKRLSLADLIARSGEDYAATEVGRALRYSKCRCSGPNVHAMPR